MWWGINDSDASTCHPFVMGYIYLWWMLNCGLYMKRLWHFWMMGRIGVLFFVRGVWDILLENGVLFSCTQVSVSTMEVTWDVEKNLEVIGAKRSYNKLSRTAHSWQYTLICTSVPIRCYAQNMGITLWNKQTDILCFPLSYFNGAVVQSVAPAITFHPFLISLLYVLCSGLVCFHPLSFICFLTICRYLVLQCVFEFGCCVEKYFAYFDVHVSSPFCSGGFPHMLSFTVLIC